MHFSLKGLKIKFSSIEDEYIHKECVFIDVKKQIDVLLHQFCDLLSFSLKAMEYV